MWEVLCVWSLFCNAVLDVLSINHLAEEEIKKWLHTRGENTKLGENPLAFVCVGGGGMPPPPPKNFVLSFSDYVHFHALLVHNKARTYCRAKMAENVSNRASLCQMNLVDTESLGLILNRRHLNIRNVITTLTWNFQYSLT